MTNETQIAEWSKVTYRGSIEAYRGMTFSATFCYCDNIRCPGYNLFRGEGAAFVDLHHVRRESITPA